MPKPEEGRIEERQAHKTIPTLASLELADEMESMRKLHVAGVLDPSTSTMYDDRELRGVPTNPNAPVSSLPLEVLSAIFEAGCHLSASAMDHCSFEVLVSHVTKHWRNVALNTPRLWIRLNLHTCRSSTIDMANSYLSRSGASLVDLHIEMRFEEIWQTAPYDAPGMMRVMQIYNSYLDRWMSLRVNSNWHKGLYYFIRGLDTSPPNIRLLQISLHKPKDFRPIVIDLNIFDKFAPALTSVRLRGVGPPCCRLPLTTVTTLELYQIFPGITIDSNTLRSMLNCLPALKHLVICGDLVDNWTLGDIELPSLQSLHLCGEEDTSNIVPFLETISAPILHSLLLEVTEASEFKYLFFLSRPRYPTLRSLTLSLHKLAEPFIWFFLADAFPSITQLTLFYNSIDHCLRFLQLQTSTETIERWSDLHTLTLIRGYDQISLDLRGMVSGRIDLQRPIRKLRLSPSIMALAGDDMDWLRERVEVEVSTVYPELSEQSPVVPYIVHWPGDDE